MDRDVSRTHHYKAFISYSHRDEAWAAWLHRSLEAYRVPRRLVGSPGRFGPVPARLSPVFRDRDELPSAADLSDTVKAALADSETLIVICSPAAAGSEWVAEEIRHFRALGRGERILCMIVDGDPHATAPELACFPPALREDEDGAAHEPLAADARKWADGKSLAKLKLVAGVLGIRLDELRRRELQRKRKLRSIGALAAIAVVALALTAVRSRMAEQQALQQQQRDREHAEQMLSQFIEASEELKQVADLQTRRKFSEVAAGFLDNLDADDLSIESRRNLGRILLEQGEIAWSEGHQQQSLRLFTESRRMLGPIRALQPDNPSIIFDLGQVEYWIGRIHYDLGRLDEALGYFTAYHEASRSLMEIDPDNADWIMETAYALGNLASVETERVQLDAQQVLAYRQAALVLAERAAGLDAGYGSELPRFYAHLADAWLGVCNVGEALSARLNNARYAGHYRNLNPANNTLKRRYAFALAGLARVQRRAGQIDLALDNLGLAMELLGEIFEEDPTNLLFRWNLLNKSARAAHLRALGGDLAEASAEFQTLETLAVELLAEDVEVTLEHLAEYADYSIKHAHTALMLGENTRAGPLLDRATDMMRSILAEHPEHRDARELLLRALFYRWALDPGTLTAAVTAELDRHGRALESAPGCEAMDLSARLAVMRGSREQARAEASALRAKGYHDPEFRGFCRQYDVCAR